jgi:hypothetical protein
MRKAELEAKQIKCQLFIIKLRVDSYFSYTIIFRMSD